MDDDEEEEDKKSINGMSQKNVFKEKNLNHFQP